MIKISNLLKTVCRVTLSKCVVSVILATALFICLAFIEPAVTSIQDSDEKTIADTSKPVDVRVKVANLKYGLSLKTNVCFASGYLELLRRETDIKIDPEPVEIELGSEDLYKYPFVVMSGEGQFQLSELQVEAMHQYLEAGGFILASSGCSNDQWNKSFITQMSRVYPEQANAGLVNLSLDHEMFHIVFNITSFQTKNRGKKVQLFGLVRNGRLVMVYSPEGLNDTGNAGGKCCCCGGNEIRNAKYINANILAYVLQG